MRLLVAWVLVGSCSLCALALGTSKVRAGPDPEKIPSGRPVFFAAEMGITPDILGMGFERNLTTTDANGIPHRVYPNKTVEVAVNQYDAKFEIIDNSLLLDAHAHYLFVQAGVKTSTNKRYMIVRAYQVSKVTKLVAEGPPMARAPMYASKIYYGWALYVVIEGESSTFTTEVAANLMAAGGRLATAIKSYRLTSHIHLIGLQPKKTGDVPLVVSVDEVRQNFETARAAQPIFVEYALTQDLVADVIPWSKNELKPGSYFVAVDLAVMDSKANGKSWDVGSLPDPLVTLLVNGRAEASCKQQDSMESHCLRGRMIDVAEDTTIAIHVEEADLVVNDPVGDTFPLKVMRSGATPGTPIQLKTTGQLRWATLTLTPVR
jgi:hypothetical protein